MREDHKEAVKIYKETVNVDRALKVQAIEAIEPLYIQTLKNSHTMKIHQSVPDILTFLFQCYGEIEDQSQFEKENEIRNISFGTEIQPQ